MRLSFALALLPVSLAAQDLTGLTWPVDCTLGTTCYIQNLVDRDPGPEARDLTCGTRTYDGHRGTDIALPTLADQGAGVEVRAVLPGRIVALRDGMEDRLQTRDGTGPDVTDRECGNGVVIDHADGWRSQYCHMAGGSLRVAEGDEVAAGEALGLIGLSGNTEFPHLHLNLFHEDAVIDPFDPDPDWTCGERPAPALWADPVQLPTGGFIGAGFTTAIPDMEAVTRGPLDAPSGRDGPLVLYGYYHGLEPEDEIALLIENGDGIAFESREPMTEGLARGFRAGGRNPPEGGWPAGRYRGTVVLFRNGQEIDRREVEITLD